jgi:hypothetical protein
MYLRGIRVGCAAIKYSVSTRFIGHRLRVKLSASAVTVYDRSSVVARHQRAVSEGAKVLDLDHYLKILRRKPGALPGATALAQARAAKAFTAEHDAIWAAARKAHGDAGGTRAVVEVLLLAPPPRPRRRAGPASRCARATTSGLVEPTDGVRALDVGAGTGIAALQLRHTGADVVAVEPDSRTAAVGPVTALPSRLLRSRTGSRRAGHSTQWRIEAVRSLQT